MPEYFQYVIHYSSYDVVAMTDPVGALNLFRNDCNAFDLVLTDLTMPGMTGDELAKEILKLRPDIPVILCTGFNDRISAEKVRAIGVRAFVVKPMTMKDIAILIRDSIDNPVPLRLKGRYDDRK